MVLVILFFVSQGLTTMLNVMNMRSKDYRNTEAELMQIHLSVTMLIQSIDLYDD